MRGVLWRAVHGLMPAAAAFLTLCAIAASASVLSLDLHADSSVLRPAVHLSARPTVSPLPSPSRVYGQPGSVARPLEEYCSRR